MTAANDPCQRANHATRTCKVVEARKGSMRLRGFWICQFKQLKQLKQEGCRLRHCSNPRKIQLQFQDGCSSPGPVSTSWLHQLHHGCSSKVWLRLKGSRRLSMLGHCLSF